MPVARPETGPSFHNAPGNAGHPGSTTYQVPYRLQSMYVFFLGYAKPDLNGACRYCFTLCIFCSSLPPKHPSAFNSFPHHRPTTFISPFIHLSFFHSHCRSVPDSDSVDLNTIVDTVATRRTIFQILGAAILFLNVFAHFSRPSNRPPAASLIHRLLLNNHVFAVCSRRRAGHSHPESSTSTAEQHRQYGPTSESKAPASALNRTDFPQSRCNT